MRARSTTAKPPPKRHALHGKRLSSPRKSRSPLSAKRVLIAAVMIIVGLYAAVLVAFYNNKGSNDSGSTNAGLSPDRLPRRNVDKRPVSSDVIPKLKRNPVKKEPPPEPEEEDFSADKSYKFWRALAVEMATLSAPEILESLEEIDPFGTRSFEESVLHEETRLKRTLTLDEIKELFPCPEDRISLPDQRNEEKANAFRRGDRGTFLFFQHLRKAGGTHFCSMAEANLPKSAVSRYYCMPDMDWTGGKGAGYLHHFSSDEIARRMEEKGHRVAGNEWDNFDVEHHFDLPAVFATSFRRPLDRALSQFRFECIEDRGCKIKDVGKWWDKRKDLYNVYLCTFSDGDCRKSVYEGTTEEDAKKRGELMGAALDTVAKFNLVLAMEWLAYAGPQVQSVLGFENTSVLTKRVRPHIQQAQRNDGQEENKGAAGIAKASWVPKDYLTPAQFEAMSQSLALDEVLTDAARRMFLERLVCPS